MVEIDTGIMAGNRKVTVCAPEEPSSESELIEIGYAVMECMGLDIKWKFGELKTYDGGVIE